MNCQNCGQQLQNNASFCSNCGAFIDSAATAAPPAPTISQESSDANSTENIQQSEFSSPQHFSSQLGENNPPVYSPAPPTEQLYAYPQQPLQQAGFVTQPQEPALKKNSMVPLLVIVTVLSVLLIGAISIFLVGSLSGGRGSEKIDRDTNVLLVKDTRGRYYTVHSDGTAEPLDILKDSIYFLASKDERMYAPVSMGSSEDFSQKLFFSSDYSKYYTSNNAKDIVSDLILLNKKNVKVLDGATFCHGSRTLDTLYYVSQSGKNSALSVYYAKTGKSVVLDDSRNVQNLSRYASACSSNGKVFMYVLGNPDSSKDTTAYKIVNGSEPVEIGKNIYPVSISNNQSNFIYYELDSKGKAQLFHETGGKTITIASRVSEEDLPFLITNGKTTELIYQDNGKTYYYSANEKPVYLFDSINVVIWNETYYPVFSQTSFSNDSLKELVYVDTDSGQFYYFDKDGNIESYSYMGRILFSDNALYYTNNSDTLYKIDMETGERERLARNVFFFNVSNQSDTVVYTTDDEVVHTIVNGKEFSWDEYTTQWGDVSDDGKYIYFIDYDENEVYLSVEGAEPTVIDESNISFITVIGNRLFYVDFSNKLFMYNPKTNTVTEIMSRVHTIIPTFPLDIFKAIYQ